MQILFVNKALLDLSTIKIIGIRSSNGSGLQLDLDLIVLSVNKTFNQLSPL